MSCIVVMETMTGPAAAAWRAPRAPVLLVIPSAVDPPPRGRLGAPPVQWRLRNCLAVPSGSSQPTISSTNSAFSSRTRTPRGVLW